MGSDILATIEVPVERQDDDPHWIFPVAANRTYEMTLALDFSRIAVARGLLEPIVAMVKSFDEILPALAEAERARRARLRRMHHLYRMRRR